MTPPLRATDRRRAGTIAALRRGYLDGQLSTETFEARVAAAHRAREAQALRALVADLGRRWRALHAAVEALGARSAALGARRAPAVQATILLSRCPRSGVPAGRAGSCTLRFGGPAVSRHHARFERVAGRWYVTDLSSTNGTFVDGVRVERAPLDADAVVQLADTYIVVA